MGASPGPALGAGVIGDIFKLEERGRAMGVFFAVSRPFHSISRLFFYLKLLGLPDRTKCRSFCWRYVYSYYFTLDWFATNVQVGLRNTIHGESCKAAWVL